MLRPEKININIPSEGFSYDQWGIYTFYKYKPLVF